jgi:hypothetical protein
MTDVNDLNDPSDDVPPREVPDCTTCCDQGFVPDLTGETGTANCPECNPTAEQVAATTAEYQRRVAAGEISADPKDWF